MIWGRRGGNREKKNLDALLQEKMNLKRPFLGEIILKWLSHGKNKSMFDFSIAPHGHQIINGQPLN